eukprot:TRINITY_DN1434_c0_g1_i1.p1 TRINITY_DN1434_c0_g1~~TRINITY_DN1434_c0_g1_i1.p1  ORF type:complete len:234 (-),score=54.59 TRINITY_DN1434_c0_g1_i1:60-761(-)
MLGRAINRSVRRRKTLYNKSISLDKNMNMGVSQLYRWTSTQNNLGKFPTIKHADNSSTNQDPSKKQFSYMVMGVTAAATLGIAQSVVNNFVGSMSASADVLALANIEFDLDTLGEGEGTTVKWQGKPLFIRHRTSEEIEAARGVDPASLRDPAQDEDRVIKSEYLVLIGICTHLGCVPIPEAGQFNGFFCPCHGSHYDTSGRIRAGPAPLNLEVPPYYFTGEGNKILVGKSAP